MAHNMLLKLMFETIDSHCPLLRASRQIERGGTLKGEWIAARSEWIARIKFFSLMIDPENKGKCLTALKTSAAVKI